MPNRLTKGRALLGSTSIDRDLDVRGDATFHGATAGLRSQYLAKSADHAVTAAESGATFVNTKGSGSTVFSLPATVAGLVYTFLESNASGEITVRPVAADKIMGGGLTRSPGAVPRMIRMDSRTRSSRALFAIPPLRSIMTG